MYQKKPQTPQPNKDDLVIDWSQVMDYISSHSVPNDKLEDVCSFVFSVVEADIHLDEENVPNEISELFNDTFTFEFLCYIVGRIQHMIKCQNVALLCRID